MSAGADADRCQDLSLQVRHRIDVGIPANHELQRKSAAVAILNLVGEQPEVLEAGILNGQRQRRKAHRRDIDSPVANAVISADDDEK